MVLSCPVCSACDLVMEARGGTHAYDFHGVRVVVAVEYCACPKCGRQITHGDQDRRNAERISHANLEILAAHSSFKPPDRAN